MKTRTGPFLALILGSLLMLASSLGEWGYVSWAREWRLENKAEAKYSVKPIRNNFSEIEFGDSRITLRGFPEEVAPSFDSKTGEVELDVNGRVTPLDFKKLVAFCFDRADYPYWGFWSAAELKMQESGESFLTVTLGVGKDFNPNDWCFQILFIDGAGSVSSEMFDGAVRSKPLYRKILAQYAGPSMGYRSQALVQWPTIWYPILYPWITTLLGLIFCVVGLVWNWRAKKRSQL